MRKSSSAPLAFLEPMLPTLVEVPPEGDDWIHEVKYDGYRTQLIVQDGRCQAYTRRGFDWSAKYPTIVQAACTLPCRSAIIDGEAIATTPEGKSEYMGAAFVTFPKPVRERLWARVQGKVGAPPPKGMAREKAEWVKPGLIGRVRTLKGEEKLRHAKLLDWGGK